MTPANLKAFLDDLVRISLRHGVVIEDWEEAEGLFATLRPVEDGFRGYSAVPADDVTWLGARWNDNGAEAYIESIDITKLSNHERLAIHGNHSPHLAEMLREKCERYTCLLYTSPSPRDRQKSRMPSSA